MKVREYEISVLKGDEWGTFRFQADNKELALDHVDTLKHDIDFRYCYGRIMCSGNYNERVRELACRFVGWVEA